MELGVGYSAVYSAPRPARGNAIRAYRSADFHLFTDCARAKNSPMAINGARSDSRSDPPIGFGKYGRVPLDVSF